MLVLQAHVPTRMPKHPSKVTENKKAFQYNIDNLLAVM